MIRLFSLSGDIDGHVLRAILLADLIGLVGSLAFYAVVTFAVRRWVKRRNARAAASPPVADGDPCCRHCPRCHAIARPNPTATKCWFGPYCEACRALLHADGDR